MSLAIFDLDNTLLKGDSDQLWGAFIAEHSGIDKVEHNRINQQFYQDYLDGNLNVKDFLSFSLLPLANNDIESLLQWRKIFINNHILPLVLPKAIELISNHRKKGDFLMIITATNRFITEPIADIFGIPTLLATEPEFINNRYTGKYLGTPTFKEGKVIALNNWLKKHPNDLVDSYFYSDSHNDIPLLNQIGNPIAVDPDDILRQYALERNWQTISLR